MMILTFRRLSEYSDAFLVGEQKLKSFAQAVRATKSVGEAGGTHLCLLNYFVEFCPGRHLNHRKQINLLLKEDGS